MELKVYCMFDSATKSFTQPWFMQNDGQAYRVFTNLINDPEKKTDVSKAPDQFTLYEVGTWCDQRGQLTSCDPRSLGNGMSFKEPEDKVEIIKLLEEIRNMVKEK